MFSLNSVRYTLALTFLLVSFFTWKMLARVRYDASSFVTAGDQFCDPEKVPPNLTVTRESAGYDGTFYYRLALDPFTSQRTDYGIMIDTPPYRQQRILYPLLTWTFSFGQSRFVPVVMVFLNFAALCLLGWLGGLYAQWAGRHALWGILLPLYPGFQLSLVRDLTEILEVSLLTGSLLLLLWRRPYWATAALCLAVLAKETALMVPLAALCVFLLEKIFRRGKSSIAWYYFTVPLVMEVFWQLLLYRNWGEFPFQAGGSALGIPLAGLYGFVNDLLTSRGMFYRKYLTELLFLAVTALCILASIRSASRVPPFVGVAWFFYLALALTLTGKVWVEDWAFLRALSEFYTLGMLLIIGGGWQIIRVLSLCAVSLTWLYVYYWFVF